MRKNDIQRITEVLTEIDKLRAMLQKLDTATFSGQQQEFNISQLINNVYKTELEEILRDVINQPEHKSYKGAA